MKMKKYIALVIAVIVLGGGAFFSQQLFVESFSPISEISPTPTSTPPELQSTPPARITDQESREQQTVKPSGADSFTFTATADGTVLDAMNVLAAQGKLMFSGRDFAGLGFLVEEINGQQSSDGYYWILRINGVLSEKGVSQAQLAIGDVAEWRYEKGY